MILCVCPNPSLDKFIWLNDIHPGKVNRISRQQWYAGGKGVHVALGIAELGEECVVLGFWGGEAGKHVKQLCEAKGIGCYGPELQEPTRTCISVRSDGDWDGTELLEPGPFVSEENMELFWLDFMALIEKASVVCMSGSWPRSDNGADYAPFIVAAKEIAVPAFVDCSGQLLLNALAANPYCIHINQHEGWELFKERSPEKIAAALIKNCSLAAVTSGAKGLYLSNKNKLVHTVCKLEKIISATGCGDSLMAGLIKAHMSRLRLTETAQLATACGSANCLREELGMFYKKDVDELLKQVQISRINYDAEV